jgi:NADH-quinone oxidoreductase subunit M
MDFPILTFLTFIPILGMILILFLPNNKVQMIKSITLFATGAQVILSVILLTAFDYSLGGINDASSFQFVEKFRWINIEGFPWIGTIKIDYFMGVDGLSTPLILLTSIVMLIATLSSWKISKSIKGYFALFLLLDTGMMGVFVSLDFFLFFVFWEIMLLPMYFLIGIWGGPRREYAAIKFFLYTLFGSIFILLVMIGLYFSTTETLIDGSKVFTFNILSMMMEFFHR